MKRTLRTSILSSQSEVSYRKRRRTSFSVSSLSCVFCRATLRKRRFRTFFSGGVTKHLPSSIVSLHRIDQRTSMRPLVSFFFIFFLLLLIISTIGHRRRIVRRSFIGLILVVIVARAQITRQSTNENLSSLTFGVQMKQKLCRT